MQVGATGRSPSHFGLVESSKRGSPQLLSRQGIGARSQVCVKASTKGEELISPYEDYLRLCPTFSNSSRYSCHQASRLVPSWYR